jgi:4-hydroxy-tetrahydrodipicolinate synthase
MARTLRGIIAAIPTPVDASGDPDFALFECFARHLLDTGCDALNVLGTTGEATSLSFDQRVGLMRMIGRSSLPMERMMVGTGAASVRDAAALTALAAEVGFAGALVLPPFYYKGVSDDGVLRYFDVIIETTKTTEIALYLYNFPALSGIAYTPELVARLVDAFGTRIAGLKDSSNDLPYARTVAGLPGDLDIFPSNVAALVEARSGIFAGCISASANIEAGICARALHAGDDRAYEAAVAVRRLFDGKPTVPCVRAVLAHILKVETFAEPLPPLVRLDAAEARVLVSGFEAIMADLEATGETVGRI